MDASGQIIVAPGASRVRGGVDMSAIRLFFLLLLIFLALPQAVRGQWQRHTIDNSSRGADGVRAADVNGDGHLDFTTGWEEGGVIRVTVNPGPGKVKKKWPAVTVGKVSSPEDAVFVDLDGDGAYDVVSSCEGGNRTVFIHWAPKEKQKYLEAAAWSTEAFPVTRKKQSWMYAVPMDVDGMNGIDLVVGSKGKNGSVGWLRSPKNPRALKDWTFHRLYDAGWIMTIDMHDMDGDGDADLVLSDRKSKAAGVKWLEHPGEVIAAQGGRWKEHLIGSQGKEVMFLKLADLNGDGLKDVICTNRNGHMEWFRRLRGEGVRWEAHAFKLPFGLPLGKSVAVGDINLDGKVDVVSTNRGPEPARCVAWQKWSTSPADRNWSNHDIGGTEGAKFDLIELIDLDADGDLDVITCEEVANLGLFWYENPLYSPAKNDANRSQ